MRREFTVMGDEKRVEERLVTNDKNLGVKNGEVMINL